MLGLIAYMALVITATGLPLGMWAHIRWPRRRADRQLLRLIHHTDRKANR
ncbi:hypothetical protein [Streptomyces antimycoticus]|nr:hypothetical protein [Streptomyces antimycoticus]